MWKRDYERAARILPQAFDQSRSFSASTHGWHKLWGGFAFECLGDSLTAWSLYRQAHAVQANIPKPRASRDEMAQGEVREQAIQAAMNFETGGDGRVRIPKTLDRDLEALKGSATAKQVEEALRCLGQYLGLRSSRPDKEYGTGPDVLWINHQNAALCADAKTEKELTSSYRKKDDLGQLADHVQWTHQNHEIDSLIPLFVGPELPASADSNPPDDVRVCALEKFAVVGETLIAAYRDISSEALPSNLPSVVAQHFEQRGLFWDEFISTLDMRKLRDESTA